MTPDAMVLRPDADYDEDKVPYTGTPELVIEIISPSNAANDWGAKQAVYAAAGVPKYWIVDPNTCAIAIHGKPAKGVYTPMSVDDEDFVHSPLLDQRLSLHRRAHTFELVTAAPPKPKAAQAPTKPARKPTKKRAK